MINSKHILINWRDFPNNDAEFKIGKPRVRKVVSSGYKTYSNVQYKTFKLSNCAIHFLHFLCEKMDNKNNIVHTKKIRTEFIKHLQKNCGSSYKDETVKKGFYELIDSNLVINYGKKLDYTINPFHYFKDSEKARKSLIEELIKFAINNRGKMKGTNLYKIVDIQEILNFQVKEEKKIEVTDVMENNIDENIV